MISLKNEYLKIEVEERGAQLCSLFSRETGKELLWNADPVFWGYHAPVLFPFVGVLNSREYRYRGKTYPMHPHGFARELPFTLTAQSSDSVTFSLTENKQTLEIYPFRFLLEITHTLKGRSLEVNWKVTNPSPDEPLFFSIGGHPAFTVPPREGQRKEDCYVCFPGREKLRYILLNLQEAAADTQHVYTMDLPGGYLKLERGLFDIDTFIYEDAQVEEASLCGPDKKPYVTVRSKGFPYFGVWTRSDEAPFVCLEPWYGRVDDLGFAGELPEKTGIQSLAPGEVFTASYTISVP